MRGKNSKIMTIELCLLLVFCMGSMLHAATFTVTTPELGNLTIVEADPYKSGDTPGNTLRVDGGTFWGTTVASGTDNLWQERTITPFNTGYQLVAGATDRVYEVTSDERANAPELVTTVTGLASLNYDVYLVHSIDDGHASQIARMLGGLQASPAIICDKTTIVSRIGTSTGDWAVGVSFLGTVVGDTISVYAKGIASSYRNDYIGLAYQVAKTAWNPAPADGDIDIATSTLLSWNTGLNATGAVNTAITKHELYMVETELGVDPNFAGVTAVDVFGVNPTNITPPITLNTDKAYHWRVDEVTATETITGPDWMFETIKAIPSFDPPLGSQPAALTKAMVGENAVLTATAGTTGGAGGAISYQWYNSDTSSPVADDAGHISGAATNELTITAAVADQGNYFCRATNASGTKDSQTASVLVKRLIAHYKFDGDLVDAIGGVNGTMADPNFITGINGDAVELNGSEYIDLGTDGTPNSSLGGGLDAGTVSVWMKATVGGFSFAGTYNDSDNTGFDCWYTTSNGLAFMVRSAAGASVYTSFGPSNNIANNQWHLITYTWDCETGKIAVYVDGLLGISETDVPVSGFTAWENSMIIGGVNYPASNDPAGPADFLAGSLDDYRVYNYSLNAYEVAGLYAAFNPGWSQCIEKPTYDFNGDCKVDLLDMAEFALSWMECSLIPASGCY
ncbi:MAG: hypothetical protein JEZ07_19285 [Phycisphaerae bacterium]|nr:hypothetical protein [Phycisphaerae bacterium]